MKQKNKNIVIYFAGGTMTGVFGAGVAKVFEQHQIYSKVEAVYGASAGAMNGAYFLARQTDLGSTIYWENLNQNFISIEDFLIGTWQRFENEFVKRVPKNQLKDALNIDYVMDVVKRKKPLDIKTVLKQNIPLYIKLFNPDTLQVNHVNAKNRQLLKILRGGINVFPYVHKVSKINGHRFIDAGIIEIIGIDYFLKKHPNSQIVVVLNRPTKTRSMFKIKNFLEGEFMEWMFHQPKFFELHANAEERLKQDIKKIKSSGRALIIAPPTNIKVKSRTTSVPLLKDAYQQGIKAGLRAIKQLL